ncbi:MAG: SO_0444 family Cu/Zn efflux transporter [Acidobacteriota bacterium]
MPDASLLWTPLWAVLRGAWETFFLAAPFVLFGLLVAGVLHVLISRRTVERWMGSPGLGAVSKAAAFGVPLPICSCGIVPVSIELKRKGASRPANLSFLITTPESSADAVFLTWAMLGPVMAVARPIASFFTALIAGVLAIAGGRDAASEGGRGEETEPADGEDAAAASAGDHDHGESAPAGHDHHHHHHHPHQHAAPVDEGAVRWGDLWTMVRQRDGAGLRRLLRRVGHYAFVEMLDDIAFWLVIGFLLAGVIVALVPENLAAGGGLLPMLVLLVAGIPLYMCASASTPVGAALVAKGVSPGAAMVFLLAGPATNAASVVLLLQHFGRRFVRIYLVSIAVGALLTGLALDFLLGAAGWQVAARLSSESSGVVGLLHTASVVLFGALLLWRLLSGATRQGLHEASDNLTSARAFLRQRFPGLRWWSVGLGCAGLLAVLYLLSGTAVVPPDSAAFRVTFGKVAPQPLGPGLRFAAPPPFGRLDVWRVNYPRKADVGFRTDLEAIARRREISMFANPNEWHSPVAAMNTRPREATYLTGDENLLEMNFTVHYFLSDPYRFFYGMENRRDFIALYARAAAREAVASRPLERLMTEERRVLEATIRDQLQEQLDGLDAGVDVRSVHVVDLHPPQEVVASFRDVSSAVEDRESRVLQAEELAERELPQARGQAALDVARADAESAVRQIEASGRAEGFGAQAEAFRGQRSLLRDLLWLESAERVLAGRSKVVVPPGTPATGVTLWREAPGALPEVRRPMAPPSEFQPENHPERP